MEGITAIIPVRKECEKLKDRNTLPFADSNLLVHKIRQLKKTDMIEKIIVSSEDECILEMARVEGVDALQRPQIYAKKKAPFAEFVEYICSQVKGEHILWACVTAPFITENEYACAARLYFDKLREGYDSLITVTRLKRYILDNNGTVNFHKGMQHQNSEDLPPLYLFTNGIILAPREKMIKWKYNWGRIPYMMEISKKMGIDIRDQYDYELAKLIYAGGESFED